MSTAYLLILGWLAGIGTVYAYFAVDAHRGKRRPPDDRRMPW